MQYDQVLPTVTRCIQQSSDEESLRRVLAYHAILLRSYKALPADTNELGVAHGSGRHVQVVVQAHTAERLVPDAGATFVEPAGMREFTVP